MSYTALLIPADEELPVRRVDLDGSDGAGLRQLQDLVGGHIEALPVPDADLITAYGHDEAKLIGLDKNARATRLMGPILFAGDHIAGNLVVCGFDPSTGENTDLPEGFETRLNQVRELRPPDRHELDLAGRDITYDWIVASEDIVPDEARKLQGGQKLHLAHLSCGHSTPGVNYFSGRQHGSEYYATLSRQTEEPASFGGTMTGFMLGDGVTFLREPTTRYNRGAFEAFGARALAQLRVLYGDSHEKVTRIFRDPRTGGSV